MREKKEVLKETARCLSAESGAACILHNKNMRTTAKQGHGRPMHAGLRWGIPRASAAPLTCGPRPAHLGPRPRVPSLRSPPSPSPSSPPSLPPLPGLHEPQPGPVPPHPPGDPHSHRCPQSVAGCGLGVRDRGPARILADTLSCTETSAGPLKGTALSFRLGVNGAVVTWEL